MDRLVALRFYERKGTKLNHEKKKMDRGDWPLTYLPCPLLKACRLSFTRRCPCSSHFFIKDLEDKALIVSL